MTLILIPMFAAYSQNFYAVYTCPRYGPVLKKQIAWLMACGSKEGEGAAAQTTLSTSSKIATISTPNVSV
ncbi:hypothetical protein Y032_0463g1910 [Ancylostoma ceylanicum]|uniref:Uncharacterized protein n=1 Tax=Ancylostoma ceylanicum TaxID=53326 RepID=A0A016WXP5_9BILA|nr:hypothetical protein Y032_0463g1910 [Ancylostoma ceylanicum]